ncbi:MAG: 50S ribosomal protein L3 [Deltaproteobacteria bacterium]|nr:50S ribosomal protein L3 [Deltaproteobacteria bacterium]
MNRNLGLIGRKMGCTQLFLESGDVVQVTVVETGPCTVIAKRTQAKDGYSALCLAWGDRAERLVKRPVLGQFKKANVKPAKVVRELRVPEDVLGEYEVGRQLGVGDVFKKGELVDVTGTSKGRGFAGVIKRHGFNSFVAGHGTHEYFRHSGSIGQNMNPGRTFPGLRMAGHMGASRVTTVGMRLADIDAEQGLLMIRGAVPGHRNSVIVVRKSHRRAEARQQLLTVKAAVAGAKKK